MNISERPTESFLRRPFCITAGTMRNAIKFGFLLKSVYFCKNELETLAKLDSLSLI